MADLVYPAHGPRHEETFPDLTHAGNRPLATLRRPYASISDGEKLYEAGKVAPGMFVVLKGLVSVTQRDGLGPCRSNRRSRAWVTSWPRSVSSPAARRWWTATAEGDVETLLIPTDGLRSLLVAEADLGERIMRALILRRVALLQGGACGVVLIGSPASADVIRLESFLTRNGYPHHLLDPATDPEAQGGDRPIRRYCRRVAAGGLPRRLGARQSVGADARPSNRDDVASRGEFRL